MRMEEMEKSLSHLENTGASEQIQPTSNFTALMPCRPVVDKKNSKPADLFEYLRHQQLHPVQAQK